ncbi:MAG: hypothetical protein HZA61_06850 [Candidatus Eisenbacteria bacterium]|uniref:Uncharacterized protein n=1 Tax=Eiseniibacteriota bacterium TaxID=2212470 RepID=A0A933SBC5_UNCEI|nr:hypothetical protein [Candidatus Eisenbacteria bacterium]
MKKFNRSWGKTVFAWLIVLSLTAPTLALAWTPGGEKPIDNGDEPSQPGMEAVGDPSDGTSGAPRRAELELSTTIELLLSHYLRMHVDERLLGFIARRAHVRSWEIPTR